MPSVPARLARETVRVTTKLNSAYRPVWLQRFLLSRVVPLFMLDVASCDFRPERGCGLAAAWLEPRGVSRDRVMLSISRPASSARTGSR